MFVVVLFLSFLLILSALQLRNRGHLSWKYYVGNHRHKAVTTADIIYISPWMTFDYINKLFNLPQNYLEQNLEIHDSKYPFITVQKYSKNSNISQVILIDGIRNTVRQYIISSTQQ